MSGSLRYHEPRLQELLAGEYVLGSLQGRARRRFERLLLDIPALRDRVNAWAGRLEPLSDELEPVTPPAELWQAIEARLAASTPDRWRNPRLWRRLGLLASAATLLLAVISGMFWVDQRQPQRLVMVTDETSQPVWVVKVASRQKQLQIKTMKQLKMPPDKFCVLWLEWPDGYTTPVGVLSDDPGESRLPLPVGMKRKPERATVAVSIESGRQAPSRPQGKIVFRGNWVEL